MDLFRTIAQSINWRRSFDCWGEDQALRLFAGKSDGIDGLLIEKFGPFVLATLYCYHDLIKEQASSLLAALEQLMPNASILIKARLRPQSNDYFYLNNKNYASDAVFTCYEGDCAFEVHCDPRHDYGLYLDTKAARTWVRSRSDGLKVLNLFSYTCAFAVAAAKGGATDIVNIDPAKEYLDWGGRNADLNNVVFKRYSDTTQSYLSRHLRRLDSGKDNPYDLIIVDPPAFLVGRGDERLARKMWPEWMRSLAHSRCNEFLVVINDKDLARLNQLDHFLRQGLGDGIKIETIPQGDDILGQGGLSQADGHYYIPEIFLVRK